MEASEYIGPKDREDQFLSTFGIKKLLLGGERGLGSVWNGLTCSQTAAATSETFFHVQRWAVTFPVSNADAIGDGCSSISDVERIVNQWSAILVCDTCYEIFDYELGRLGQFIIRNLFLQLAPLDYRAGRYNQSESGVDDQENHGPMGRAVGFFFKPEPGAVEAIVLGLVGVFVFRLGFYRDNEWLCIVGGVGIFLATVSFVINVARIIISHI